MQLLSTITVRKTTFKNRIVMPPMCMYMAEDGLSSNFHFTHYTSRAVGGVGYIIVEATGVRPEGRISDYDLGLWNDDQIEGLAKIVNEVHEYGSKIGIQLSHAGRKSETTHQTLFGPSPIAHSARYPAPSELTKSEIKAIVEAFGQSAQRADKAGFDTIEIHAAHGYLVHQFLSPLSNLRTDEYGGSLNNRSRFLKEVLEEVRSKWPNEKLLTVRVSASDYDPNGLSVEDVSKVLLSLKDTLDIVHVSSGGNATRPMHLYPGYQVEFADFLRKSVGLPVIAVGLLNTQQQVEDIIEGGKADFVALGRELLRHPFWTNDAYAKDEQFDQIPESYLRAYR